MSEVVYREGVALIPAGSLAVITPGVSRYGSSPAGTASTSPVKKDEAGDEKIAIWGDSNDFPQKIIELASKNTIIPETLNWKARAAIGRGVLPVEMEWDDYGRERIKVVRDEGIWSFLNSISFKRYLIEASMDLFWFFNVFPEMILSKDRKEIVQLHVNDASYCRWSAMNSKGISEHVYVNANWPDATATDKETTRIPALDPYAWDVIDTVRSGKDWKYIYPFSYPTPGKSFYQLAHWDSIRTSGWLDVINAIPQYKKYFMENQMTLKYLVKIPYEYWGKKYGDKFRTGSESEKSALIRKEMEGLNKFLTGVENTGKALAVHYWSGENGGQGLPAWEITPIADTIKDGKFIEDNQEANSNLLYALGVDPSITGFAPGAKMGSGSGSDKREAFLMYVNLLQTYRDKILEPLNFVAEYNGWKARYPFLQFRMQDVILTTLDAGKGTQKVVS